MCNFLKWLVLYLDKAEVVFRSVISFLYSSFSCSCTAPQHLSPTSSQRASLSPDRLLPTPPSPMSSTEGSISYSHQQTSSRLRAKFQGRRSYSEVRLHVLVEHENDNYIVKYFYVFYFVLILASCFQGIWHISQPKAPSSSVKVPSIYASQTQARPWGHAGLQSNQKSALYLTGGFGQTSISSWSWSGERRRKGRRKVWWQQPEQQSLSLCSRPGLSCGCWGEK